MEKEKEDKMKTWQTGSENILECCPGCNSEMVWRIQRTEAEKIISYLSKGLYAVKKYLCRSCGHHILVHQNSVQYMPLLTDAPNENELLDFVTCQKCSEPRLQLETVAEDKQENPAPETRKVICAGCGNETVINKYEYDAADSSGF